jgi:hypothetical protein
MVEAGYTDAVFTLGGDQALQPMPKRRRSK